MINDKDRKEFYRHLPSSLVEELRLLFTDVRRSDTKDNLLKAVCRVYGKSKDDLSMGKYIPLADAYWIKIYGGNFKVVINPLLKADILQKIDIRDYVKPPEKQAYLRYRINPNLLNKEVKDVYQVYDSKKFDVKRFKDISIDVDKAIEYVNANAKYWVKIRIGDVPLAFNDSYIITYKRQFGNSYLEYKDSIGNIKKKAIDLKLSFFQYKDSYYLVDESAFIEEKIESVKHHYIDDITKLSNYGYSDFRYNEKTGRQYNELTNFPKNIFEMLRMGTKFFVELDVKTSQFLIFANIINTYLIHGKEFLIEKFRGKKVIEGLKLMFEIMDKHEIKNKGNGITTELTSEQYKHATDLDRFINDVFFHDLYTIVEKHIGLDSRDQAKILVFRLLFKRTSRKDMMLDLIKNLYPTMIDIVHGIKDKLGKDENDDDQFPLYLSHVEGEIILKNIYKPLRKQGIKVITRHDSLSVTEEHIPVVKKMFIDVFESYGFKLNTSETHMLYDKQTWDEMPDGFVQHLVDSAELKPDSGMDQMVAEDEWHEKSKHINKEIISYYKYMNGNSEIRLDQEAIEVLEKIQSLDEIDNDLVSVDDLRVISTLDFIDDDYINEVLDDIENIRVGMTSLSDKTLELLKWLSLNRHSEAREPSILEIRNHQKLTLITCNLAYCVIKYILGMSGSFMSEYLSERGIV